MPLQPGDKLGHYEVVSLLGQGGMGEVYRARDTKLDRDVAIKVLPQLLARDPDRLARFKREAKVLASLDHPNIGHIYGIVDSGETHGLVLALIEGPTLADRIAAGPVPLDEALSISKQIIEALEYSHDRSIVHRDLKPANIKITPDGAVKVLDFGLAKVLEDEPTPSLLANSPTLTWGHTRTGLILGTAAYMSPEQALGRPADRRSDIFSFGAVLFELLTGRRAFTGTSTPDLLEAVLKKDPDWSALPAGTPGYLRRLLERTLQKDRKQRLQAIGEARIMLAQPQTDQPASTSESTPPSSSRFMFAALAAVLAVALAGLAAIHFREQPPASPKLVRFHLSQQNNNIQSASRFALSPDGTRLAYYATGTDGIVRLWVRALDSLQPHPLPATGLNHQHLFFWSYDSRFLVFPSTGKLKKIDASGGPAQTLCDAPGTFYGGSWNQDGTVIFTSGEGQQLMRVSSEGGTASPLASISQAPLGQSYRGPLFLPDGRHFLYWRSGNPESRGIYIGLVDGQPEPAPVRLLASDYYAGFVPLPTGTSGMLLFLREGTLLAQPFDLRDLNLSGEALPVAEGVTNHFTAGQFSASRSGALVYRTGAAMSGRARLTWLDRQGKTLGTTSDADYDFEALALSPDGTRAAALVAAEQLNIWLVDLLRASRTRFTVTQSGFDQNPTWSPDGKWIAFSSSRSGQLDLYQRASDGSGGDELLLKFGIPMFLTDWSRDGRFLLFSQRNAKGILELWLLPMGGQAGGPERKPIPFLRTDFGTYQGHFSPDSRWIAYSSNESGKSEIYVRPFPAPSGGGGKWMISQNGGREPRWRRDGKELFYLSADADLMAAQVNGSGEAFQAGLAMPLFRTAATPAISQWDVNADGTRFVFPVISGQEITQSPFTVVLNWTALLKK